MKSHKAKQIKFSNLHISKIVRLEMHKAIGIFYKEKMPKIFGISNIFIKYDCK